MRYNWNFKKHVLVSIIIVFVLFLSTWVYTLLSQLTVQLVMKSNQVAIIGGADGPTSIYISQGGVIDWWSIPLYAIFLAFLLILYVPIKLIAKKSEK